VVVHRGLGRHLEVNAAPHTVARLEPAHRGECVATAADTSATASHSSVQLVQLVQRVAIQTEW
jgi:hypothetical protein